MDWKLELVAVPVTDVDRAKGFYADKLGFHLEADTAHKDDAGGTHDAAWVGVLGRH